MRPEILVVKTVVAFALTIGLVIAASAQDRNAIELSEEAVRLSPSSAEAWYKLGVAKFSRVARENTKAAFERAIELNPDYSDAYFALGVWHLSPKRSCALGALISRSEIENSAQLALGYLNKAIELKPNYPQAFVWLGKAYERLDLTQDAAKAYEKAIEQKTEDITVYLSLAGIYRKSSRYDEALTLYKGAISKADQLRRTNEKGNQSDPDNYYNSMLTVLYLRPAYYSLAGLYVQLGRDFEALEIYKEVIRLGLDQADTHYEIGLLFVKFGDKDSAENAFRTLVERAADQKHNGTRKELKKDAKILRKRILAM